MIDFTDIQSLKLRLSKPLPGITSHLKMAPEHRAKELEDASSQKPTAKKSAVMILFFIDKQKNTKIIFIRRSDYVGIHAGQMGLPGGRYEEEDKDTLITALRETTEEIGISAEKIEVVGKLSGIYIPSSNFFVDPYIGFLKEKPEYTIDAREVKEVVEINLSDLIKEDAVRYKHFVTHGKSQTTLAPYYLIDNVEIWGATAMIISELIDIIKE
jgi:8-oxo-dGTP pyrophosphatase MutT (NUDIX family)